MRFSRRGAGKLAAFGGFALRGLTGRQVVVPVETPGPTLRDMLPLPAGSAIRPALERPPASAKPAPAAVLTPVASPSVRQIPRPSKTQVKAPARSVDANADGDPADEMAGRGIEGRARIRERERIAAIVRSPEAEGRKELALTLAIRTRMPRHDAIALLASMPRAYKLGGYPNAAAVEARNRAEVDTMWDDAFRRNAVGSKIAAERAATGKSTDDTKH